MARYHGLHCHQLFLASQFTQGHSGCGGQCPGALENYSTLVSPWVPGGKGGGVWHGWGVYTVTSVQPERPPGKEIPGIPLSLRPPGCGGRQVTLQLITKLERLRVSVAAARPQRDRNRRERYDSVCWHLFTKLLSHHGEAEECSEHSGGKTPGRNNRLL